jgi:tetratricopeptide (TPR) repeat protein
VVQALASLAPLVLVRDDAKQRADIGVVLRAKVIQGTGLARLAAQEQERVVALLQERIDGVFLAARLVVDRLVEEEESLGSPLTLARVEALMGGDGVRKGDALVDALYAETLQRVLARLDAAAERDPEVAALLRGALRQMLAVLLAVAVPVRLAELPRLCRLSGVATRVLLSALSLMFSAPEASVPIQPLHKSVFDFLRDPARAGAMAVSDAEGHRLLAQTCREAWLAGEDGSKYVQAHSATHLAACAMQAQKAKDAAAEAEVTRWLARLAEEPDDAAAGTLLEAVGDRLQFLGMYTLAVRYFEMALPRHVKVARGKKRGPEVARVLVSIAHNANSAAEYGKALKALQQAQAALRGIVAEDSVEMAQIWFGLGRTADFKGNFPLALEYYQRALAIRQQQPGKQHGDTAKTYNNIAGVNHSQGKYEEALNYYQKSLVMFGEQHPDTAASYNNIAIVYFSQGKYKAALEYHQKSLAIKLALLGEQHPNTAQTYNNMAIVFKDTGRYEDALKYHRKSLSIKQATVGEQHPDTASTYNNIAAVYDSQGKYADALKYYKKSLAIELAALGEQHPATADTYNNMALVHMNINELAEAENLYHKALAIYQATVGELHPRTGNAFFNLALLCLQNDQRAEAKVYFQKAHTAYAQCFEATHRLMLNVTQRLAAL